MARWPPTMAFDAALPGRLLNHATFLDTTAQILRRGLAAVLCSLPLGSLTAQVDTARIDAIRVAFTLNFARYTAWPEGAPADSFRLCVSAGDSLYEAFSSADNTMVRGRPVRLRRIAAGATDAVRCDLLYVSGTAENRSALLHSVASLPVLTVGDDPMFLGSGGTIRLFTGDQRMQFDINLAQAERARLVLSPQLLRLARSVNQDKAP
ncbi:YfiR family protein [Rhizobacter sp. Root29]|uniref:YfiR family protein n=2 Tax=Rhizobacter TaxID=212743 RepID=UPI0009E9CB28|nr:YfiR family protein [Rhizobacter sp. Root29]